MIGGRRPIVPEILSQSDRVGAKFEQAAITPKRYEIGYKNNNNNNSICIAP